MISALLSKPVFGWSPRQVPPSELSNWYAATPREFMTSTSSTVLVRDAFGPPGGKPISVKKMVFMDASYRQRTSPSAKESWNKVARLTSGWRSVPFTLVSRAARLIGSQTAFGLPARVPSWPTHRPWSGGVTAKPLRLSESRSLSPLKRWTIEAPEFPPPEAVLLAALAVPLAIALALMAGA